MSPAVRIDVHQHIVPPFWAEVLLDHGGDPSGWVSPEWSAESAIEFMDSQNIAMGILSLSAPSVVGWKDGERREIARRVNEYTAGFVAKWPDRFGNFATLPLPDVDGSLQEIDYAFEALRCDGVVVLSNYDGVYLGDARYEPVWAELDRREALIFIHPGKPNIPALEGVPSPIVDYPFDTTRTAVHMVVQGVLHRHRRATFILPHAGGFLPYASHRFAELTAAVKPDFPRADELLALFRRFMFDTALASGPAALPSLIAFAGADRVLYGSDFPYAPPAVRASFTAKLDAYGGLGQTEKAAINCGNARRLFKHMNDRAGACS